MTFNANLNLLLAQADNDVLLKSIRTATNSGPSTLHLVIVIGGLFALVGLVVVSARFLGRERPRQLEPHTDYLGMALETLGLSAEEQRDIQRVAERSGRKQPAAMLLSPGNLSHALDRALAEDHDEQLQRRVERLCRKLFDVPLPDPPQTRPPAAAPPG